MNYCRINSCDIANGPGVRVSLFVAGCRRHCPGCFNSETWDFAAGKPFTPEVQERILRLLAPEHIAGLTILGGEPFEPENQPALLPLVKAVSDRFPDKTIWAYTGFLLDDLKLGGIANGPCTDALLSFVDVLVDGPFIIDRQDVSLMFRGSSNQRVIELNRYRKSPNSHRD